MLFFIKLSYGRGYFHSLFFVFICFGILFVFTKGNKPISVSFLIGMLLHLLLDLPGIPLFYPFVQYNFIYVEEPFPYWTNTLLTNPIVQITEISGLLILVFILIKNKLYSFKDIVDYLKTSPEIISYIKPKQEVIVVED